METWRVEMRGYSNAPSQQCKSNENNLHMGRGRGGGRDGPGQDKGDGQEPAAPPDVRDSMTPGGVAMLSIRHPAHERVVEGIPETENNLNHHKPWTVSFWGVVGASHQGEEELQNCRFGGDHGS